MPQPGQKTVTLKEQTYLKAKELAKKDRTPKYPNGKPVAKFVADLIEKKTKEA